MSPFSAEASWIAKVLISAILIAPFTTFIVFFNKQFGMRGEVFFFAWILGTIIAFLLFARLGGTMATLSVPLIPFLAAMVLGVCIGGVANLLYAQSIPMAPNPGLPPALFSISIPLAYLLSYGASKIVPNQLPHIEFNWINFGGILVLIIALAMITHRSH